MLDAIDVAVAEGADVATVQARIQEVLPERTEVVTNEVLVDEAKAQVDTFISAFGTGLLIFAFVTAFVSAFLINNVFAITIGQRLRELAMMRAVGATGRQVRRMIYLEALVMSLIATVLGVFGGIGVARLIINLFNAAGLGFPDSDTVLLPRTIVIAFLVGVGITMLSVIVPARRAARIPPVAAMRPELGFEVLSTKRLVVGTVVVVVGAVHVRARAVRPARRHARADRPRRRWRAAAVPRRRQRVVDRRPAGDQGDRLAGRPAVRRARASSPGRTPGATRGARRRRRRH